MLIPPETDFNVCYFHELLFIIHRTLSSINFCCKLSTRKEVSSPEEMKNILCVVQLANAYQVAEAVMKISSLRNAVRNIFLKEVDAQCAMLCVRKGAQPSILRVPSEHHKNLVEFHWNHLLREMTERAPDVLDFMTTVAVPKLKGNDGRQVMLLCTAYAILMNVR